jgi:N-acetylglucosaminyldiphosphoundecaprenol N-acetyl-beta-D-mannosaminyltransferase
MDYLRILQLKVNLVGMDSVLQFVEERVRHGTSPACIVCANPEKIYQLRSCVQIRPLYEAADVVIPDGIGMVLAARLLYGRRLRRVAGADLMQAICGAAAARNYRIFLFGSSESTNRKAVENLRNRYPGIDIVGTQHGYLEADKMDSLVSRINAARPDILFVALGSPRQEMWIQQYLPRLDVKVVQAIGGTLDTIAGTVKRAPSWMMAIGLEWFYRLLKQPSRARRDLNLIRFSAEVLRMKLAGEGLNRSVSPGHNT